MLKDSAFTIHRTPFKFKSNPDARITARKTSPQNHKAILPYSNHSSVSPYIISQLDLLRKSKAVDTHGQRNLQRFKSVVRTRAESANYHSSKPNKPEQFIYHEEKGSKSGTMKAKTSHSHFTRSASTKNIRNRSSLGYQHHPLQLNERKFIVSVVDIDKEKQKRRKLMSEKLENFNYKTVLGDNLPFKKVPKLFIDEHGVVSRQHI